MHSLRESHDAFVTDHSGDAAAWPARHEDTAVHPRFGVYRANVRATLCDALATIFPVVATLVDVRFFRQTARQYLRAHPHAGSGGRGFGCDFAQFLTSLRALQRLPYVADVARLEWALFEVRNAPEDPHHFNLARLGMVTGAEWHRLRFRMHRATALVASRYPVLRIWEANQDDTPARKDVDLDAGNSHLLVARTTERDVGVRPLSPGEYKLLQAFSMGRALEDARRLAGSVEPDFDLPKALGQYIALGVLTGFVPDAVDG